jgi:arginase family enzyme
MQVALIGVKEDRASVKNNGSADAPDLVRSRLFPLSKMSGAVKIVDLGNIEKGALLFRDNITSRSAKVTNELIRMKIVPVIIGGSHDLTYGQFGALLRSGSHNPCIGCR